MAEVLFCAGCGKQTPFDLYSSVPSVEGRQMTLLACHGCNNYVVAIGSEHHRHIVYPPTPNGPAEELPDEVRSNFAESLSAIGSGMPRAAVLMTRAALQAATRELGAKGNNLKQEIDNLEERHMIPTSIKDWAHDLRDSGNLVAHPEPGKPITIANARELVDLAEAIFEYIYVIPTRIRERRARSQEAP